MFWTVPVSIIRRFTLDTKQWYMSYRFTDSLWAGSCSQAVSKCVWRIPLLCVQWKSPDDGQRNCPKRVDFYSKNKFEKLVHLVGFIIWIRKYFQNLITEHYSETFTTLQCMCVRISQVHKIFKTLGATSKIQVPEGWNEGSLIVRHDISALTCELDYCLVFSAQKFWIGACFWL